MDLRLCALVLCMAVGSMAAVHHPLALSDEMVDYINNLPGNTWTAKKNFGGRSLSSVIALLGLLPDNEEHPVIHREINEELPEFFDAREKWPKCSTIGEVTDQGGCGSCWAYAATSSMTDRICASSNGKDKSRMSAINLISCCGRCGEGCQGGQLFRAWDYFYRSGIVTGGPYGSEEGCRPYPFPPCKHFDPHRNCTMEYISNCNKGCRSVYGKSYPQDLRFGGPPYMIKGEEQMMKELMEHGPFEVGFKVYSDFLSYESGIYKHVVRDRIGLHAVKLIGWGVEKGHKYWLVVNSWNSGWGDKGMFKMAKGSNECGIEDSGVASLL